ncbi:hypothetical protein EMCRGX_G025486 [Ephydatia muelleri]|eukprot:Em0021g310a
MEEVLREQLKIFLHLHSPGTSLSSSIDGIFLSYLSEIIRDLSDNDSDIDVTPFTDMLTAYVPEFGAINRKAVCEWVHSMTLMFSEGSSPCKLGDALPVQAAASTSPSIPHPEVQLPRELTPDTQVRSEKQAAEIDMGDHVSSEQIALIADIFPGVSKDRIRRALHHCQGNIDECVQVLLDGTERNHTHHQQLREGEQEEMGTVQALDCEKLKEFITSRYSLIDTKEDITIHRPVEPKWEGKKMIRYRDNHVVSTKGERFLVESKKEENQSTAKTSYIRPLRRYRFH